MDCFVAGLLTLVVLACFPSNRAFAQTVSEELTTGKVITTLRLDHEPSGVLMTPDSKFLYVMGCRANIVSVIDIPSHSVMKTITVGEAFEDTEDLGCYMAVTPDSRYVYVNYNHTNDIVVIKTASNEMSV